MHARLSAAIHIRPDIFGRRPIITSLLKKCREIASNEMLENRWKKRLIGLIGILVENEWIKITSLPEF